MYKVKESFSYEFMGAQHWCIPGDVLYMVVETKDYKTFVTTSFPRNTVKLFVGEFHKVKVQKVEGYPPVDIKKELAYAISTKTDI